MNSYDTTVDLILEQLQIMGSGWARAEWSLPTTEDPGLNPAISNFFIKNHFFTVSCWKDGKEENKTVKRPFLNNYLCLNSFEIEPSRQQDRYRLMGLRQWYIDL